MSEENKEKLHPDGVWVPGPLGEPIFIDTRAGQKSSKLASALIIALALACFGFVAYVFVKHGGL
jgi:hypothetical protein